MSLSLYICIYTYIYIYIHGATGNKRIRTRRVGRPISWLAARCKQMKHMSYQGRMTLITRKRKSELLNIMGDEIFETQDCELAARCKQMKHMKHIVHTCHILPPSEIDLGLCLAVFAGSGGKHLFHRIGWTGRIWQLCSIRVRLETIMWCDEFCRYSNQEIICSYTLIKQKQSPDEKKDWRQSHHMIDSTFRCEQIKHMIHIVFLALQHNMMILNIWQIWDTRRSCFIILIYCVQDPARCVFHYITIIYIYICIHVYVYIYIYMYIHIYIYI